MVESVDWQHRTEYPAPLDRRSLSGHQRPDPLGCRHDQGLCLSALADLQASACAWWRSEEHTSELQSLMRISYAVFCLKKKTHNEHITHSTCTREQATEITKNNVIHTRTS